MEAALRTSCTPSLLSQVRSLETNSTRLRVADRHTNSLQCGNAKTYCQALGNTFVREPAISVEILRPFTYGPNVPKRETTVVVCR